MWNWDYKIRAYYPLDVEPPQTPGGLAIETVHRGKHSRDTEIEVFMHRMDKGEIGRIEVVKL